MLLQLLIKLLIRSDYSQYLLYEIYVFFRYKILFFVTVLLHLVSNGSKLLVALARDLSYCKIMAPSNAERDR